mmetsp:Transcript_5788/g.19445  ORF Transcript_5788/g.19445 Transcript_5788/m.19445 type:complete len:239 (+) Transcript_5788:920-1636(+)
MGAPTSVPAKSMARINALPAAPPPSPVPAAPPCVRGSGSRSMPHTVPAQRSRRSATCSRLHHRPTCGRPSRDTCVGWRPAQAAQAVVSRSTPVATSPACSDSCRATSARATWSARCLGMSSSNHSRHMTCSTVRNTSCSDCSCAAGTGLPPRPSTMAHALPRRSTTRTTVVATAGAPSRKRPISRRPRVVSMPAWQARRNTHTSWRMGKGRARASASNSCVSTSTWASSGAASAGSTA